MRTALFIALTVVLAFAKLNPASEQDTSSPVAFANANYASLVTPLFGVVAYYSSGVQSASLFSFGVGGLPFVFSAQPLVLPNCYQPMLKQLEQGKGDSFIAFCRLNSATNAIVYFIGVNQGALSILRQDNLVFGVQATEVVISDSSYVSEAGNIYMAARETNTNGYDQSIYGYSVSTGNLTLLISGVAKTIGWKVAQPVVKAVNALPSDAGVAVIVNGDGAQQFAMIYFNGPHVVPVNIPNLGPMVTIGRHVGSTFGFTIIASGGNKATVINTYDLTKAETFAPIDTITLQGSATGSNGVNYFSTDSALYYFSATCDGGSCGGFTIYELPYQKFSFLKDQVSSIQSKSGLSFTPGVDGQFVYSATTSPSFSRWTY